MILDWIGAFLALVILDFLWGRYIQSVNGTTPFMAGFWALLIFSVGGMVTLAYVNNKWLLIPASLGAFIGTFISVKWKQVF